MQDTSAWANLTTGAWCYYANNNANGTTYGKLYNWYAVNDPRGLAPNGYHIPTDAEWSTLITSQGGNLTAGGKLKEAGSSHWLTNDAATTNSSGFTALPGGYRYGLDGAFYNITTFGGWWSFSQSPLTNSAWRYGMGNTGSAVDRAERGMQYAYSLRCLKD